ncbi:MAG TPA: hypothetical protein VF229_04355 [Burkholderiaceae bacterium]
MLWWWNFTPQIHWPLSGAVSQDIHPSLMAQAGDSEAEKQVLTGVASYGRQIGRVTDVVLALAEASRNLELPQHDRESIETALRDLRDLADRVATIKARNAPTPENLRPALDRLRARDEPGWRQLIEEQAALAGQGAA